LSSPSSSSLTRIHRGSSPKQVHTWSTEDDIKLEDLVVEGGGEAGFPEQRPCANALPMSASRQLCAHASAGGLHTWSRGGLQRRAKQGNLATDAWSRGGRRWRHGVGKPPVARVEQGRSRDQGRPAPRGAGRLAVARVEQGR
jgi:hypothetical protein